MRHYWSSRKIETGTERSCLMSASSKGRCGEGGLASLPCVALCGRLAGARQSSSSSSSSSVDAWERESVAGVEQGDGRGVGGRVMGG